MKYDMVNFWLVNNIESNMKCISKEVKWFNVLKNIAIGDESSPISIIRCIKTNVFKIRK